MSLGRNNRRRTPVFPRTPSPLSPPDPHLPPYGKHIKNLQSHPAGALRSARWLYAFGTIPFIVSSSAKYAPLTGRPCRGSARSRGRSIYGPWPSSFPAGVVGVCGRSGCPWERRDAGRCSGRCYSCGAAGAWLTAGRRVAANLSVVPCGQGSTRRIRGRSAPPRKTSIVRLPYPLEYPLP